MPILDPLSVPIPPESERLTLYWYATMLRLSYTQRLGTMTDLVQLAGGDSVSAIAGAPPQVPTLFLCSFGGGHGIVITRGTTAWPEYVAEVLGSTLITRPQYAGRVSNYFVSVVERLWPQLQAALQSAEITTWIAAGHSLGGACSALYRRHPDVPPGGLTPYAIIDCASPRGGNFAYASSYNQPPFAVPRLRITNQSDPVPLLPPSINPLLGGAPFAAFPASPLGYRHWGLRWHLWADGSATLPAEADSSAESTVGLVTLIVTAAAGVIPLPAWIQTHGTDEYARRIRAGIAVPWPLAAELAGWPGLVELDQANFALNEDQGITWPPSPAVPQPDAPLLPGDPVFPLPGC